MPATPPTGTDPGLIHTLLDRVAIHFSEGAFADEAARARAEYFAATGELREDDTELFEPRMSAFLEWYVIERPYGGPGMTPVRVYLRDGQGQLNAAEADALGRLAVTRRSLFAIKKVAAGNVILQDMLGGGELVATERRGTIGFTVGDVCEARLCPSGAAHIFTKTLLFHPRDAVKQIKAALKATQKLGEDPRALLPRLARAQLRWVRQGHVAADRIYRESLAR